jgi:hypothetical protein
MPTPLPQTDWKKEGCPPFEKPPVPPLEAAAMRASREVRLNKKKKGLAALLEGYTPSHTSYSS